LIETPKVPTAEEELDAKVNNLLQGGD